MPIEIKVPSLPESVADATVLTWHKKAGDTVIRDENLVDLETDKVVLEVPSPIDGILKEIKIAVGTKVVSEQLLGIIVEAQNISFLQSENIAKVEKIIEAPAKSEAKKIDVQAKGGPSARRVAQISGRPQGAPLQSIPSQTDTSVQMTVRRDEERIPMSRLRLRIAERLLSAQQSAAILTTFNEVNLKNIMELRAQYKDEFEKKHHSKLGFMSFFTKAVIEALKCFPLINASIDGTDIIYHHYYDIGIAVSTERGLVVPVLRNADKMSFAQIESKIGDVGRRARDNQITLEEMTGGTFTITNGGVFGSLLSTPILNPPQSAIFGMHKIEERAVVENGQVVIRPMMYLALSYDHRIIDGKDSVQFLVTVKALLEEPARLLLEI
jgi:2-oxoglutarate dehydrogenase E2 component (dihydrolipoamide succinyltransferase)